MKRFMLAVMVLVLAVALFGCGNGNAPGVSSSDTQSGTAVNIKDGQFNPKTLEAPAGAQIRWANNDGRDHQVKADDGSFDSGVLKDGGSFRYEFPNPGTYPYHCAIHTAETGSIVVK